MRAVSVDAWVTGYFHGLLGYSQRTSVNADVRRWRRSGRPRWTGSPHRRSPISARIPQLLAVAETRPAAIAFANNCQPCHGAGGGGQPGYPALAADAWIWGGTLEAIQQTITHGIRSGDPDARKARCRASAPTAC